MLKLAELKLPQLPSFESLFIIGDKSFLAILKEKDETDLIPPTYVLSKDNLEQNIGFLAQDKAVLKQGDSGNGEGIEFGKNFSEDSWRERISEVMKSQHPWIIQEICSLRNTSGVNVSNGGLFQPVVLESQKDQPSSRFAFCSFCAYLNNLWKKYKEKSSSGENSEPSQPRTITNSDGATA